MQKNCSCCSKVVLLILAVLMLSVPAGAQAGSDKFLVIHLDAISSHALFQELEGGRLPNISRIFDSGQIVRHGVTYFPGQTEIVVPRVRWGLDNSTGNPGWGYIESETGKTRRMPHVFLQMFFGVAPVSRHQFLLTFSPLHHLAGLALLNLDRLWETHQVLEFYWFNTDWMGHSRGESAYYRALWEFDRYLGIALRAGKFEAANLVIYTDHGMSMGDLKSVKWASSLEELLGENLKLADYPNIFLNDPSQKSEQARKIVQQTEIDLTLIKNEANQVQGFSRDGSFSISELNGKYRYSFQGRDYLGYGALGHAQKWLSRDEWLHLTKDHLFPALPPNLFTFFQNENAGDIVFIFIPPQIPASITATRGNHAGITERDMSVPLLFAGPAFEEVETIEEFWLQEVFSKHLPMVDFSSSKGRESHSLVFGYPQLLEMVFSPCYRLRAGLSLNSGILLPWLEYNLYHSYLSRLWLGLHYFEKTLGWQLRFQGFLGSFGLEWLKCSALEGGLTVTWRLKEQTELFLGKDRLGFRLLF